MNIDALEMCVKYKIFALAKIAVFGGERSEQVEIWYNNIRKLKERRGFLMNITVNGKALEHNIGDHYYYISFGDGLTLEVRESRDCVEKIAITEDGVTYLAGDDYELDEEDMKDYGEFWTKEEAEKWLSENVPEKFPFEPDEELFYVCEMPNKKTAVVIVRINKLNPFIINDGRLMYEAQQVTDGYRQTYYFAAEDLGTTVFRSYEEADKKRKSMES